MPRSLIALAIAATFGVSAGPAHALDLLEAVRMAAAIDPVVMLFGWLLYRSVCRETACSEP